MSRTPLQFTLDTVCVIDSVQRQGQSAEVDALVELARIGSIGLWLTQAFDSDQLTARDHFRELNLRWLEQSQVIGRVPGGFRLDHPVMGVLGGGAVLVSEQTAAAEKVIQQILLPRDLQTGNLEPADESQMKRWRKRVTSSGVV